MSILRTLETMTLDGGALPFHFINTVRDRKVEHVHNYLTSYQDIITWCRRLKLMEEPELEKLRNYALNNNEESEKAYNKAIGLREIMYDLFSAIAASQKPDAAILKKFNGYLSEALSKISLTFDHEKFPFEIDRVTIQLDKPIWIVLKDTYRLLNEDDRNRMKECKKCGWIFLDHTKNNTKLWCNPLICGSTSKATRYYHNKKRGSADAKIKI
ncbi:CGNR zinc finger domain-containing protein [Dyadobacter sp. NIV53]|uniref:CGNR zinc finger domain-containing protein n=1 Tax=Dyadobacter sp. NIV53 TaxID=2861765 RepID=UPI001C87EFB5|nr:CGNR zinc finger domain-containing protein [Dyadobacter sp. NIV53]